MWVKTKERWPWVISLYHCNYWWELKISTSKKKKKCIWSKVKDQRDRKAPNTYAVDTRAVKQQQQDHVLKQCCWINEWHCAKHRPSREFALSSDKNGVHWWLLCSSCHGDPPNATHEKSPQKARWCQLSFNSCQDGMRLWHERWPGQFTFSLRYSRNFENWENIFLS